LANTTPALPDDTRKDDTGKIDEASQTFIREVTDDFERDKLKSFWDRYGRTLIVAVSLSLIAFAGFLLWQGRQAKQRVAEADTYVAALKDMAAGNEAGAAKVFENLSKNGTKGYKTLAAFELAASDLRNKKPEDAAKKYDAIAANTSLPKPVQDFASLRALMIRFDDMLPKEAITKLAPFAQSGQPWFATAAELQAIAYLKLNDQQAARKLFEALAKPPEALGATTASTVVDDVPVSVRSRASQMVQMLGGTVKADPAAASAIAPQ
jgi:hypothetical protein